MERWQGEEMGAIYVPSSQNNVWVCETGASLIAPTHHGNASLSIYKQLEPRVWFGPVRKTAMVAVRTDFVGPISVDP